MKRQQKNTNIIVKIIKINIYTETCPIENFTVIDHQEKAFCQIISAYFCMLFCRLRIFLKKSVFQRYNSVNNLGPKSRSDVFLGPDQGPS